MGNQSIETQSCGKKIVIERYEPWNEENKNSWGYDLDLVEMDTRTPSFNGVFAKELDNHYLTESVGNADLFQKIYDKSEKSIVDEELYEEILKRAEKFKKEEIYKTFSFKLHKKFPFFKIQRIEIFPEIIDTTPLGKANQLEIAVAK